MAQEADKIRELLKLYGFDVDQTSVVVVLKGATATMHEKELKIRDLLKQTEASEKKNQRASVLLSGLVGHLRSNGFHIDPALFLNIQRVLTATDLEATTTKELRAMLSALVAKSERQQILFEEVFSVFEESFLSAQNEKRERTEKAARELVREWKKKKNNIRVALIGGTLALAVVFYGTFLTIVTIDGPLSVIQGDTVVFRLARGTHLITDNIKWHAIQNGDTIASSTLPEFKFNARDTGDMQITVQKLLRVQTRELIVDAAPCEPQPSVHIRSENAFFQPGIPLTFSTTTQNFKPNTKYEYNWSIDDRPAGKQQSQITSSFAPGRHRISLLVVYPKDTHCNSPRIQDFFEFEASPLRVESEIRELQPVKDWQAITYGALAALGCLMLAWAGVKKTRKSSITFPPPGFDEPHAISFKHNKDDIRPHPSLQELARGLAKRSPREVFSIDVVRSIRQSIKAGGFPQVVLKKVNQLDSVVTIVDKGSIAGGVAQLVEYTLTVFEAWNVDVVKLNCYGDPKDLFYEYSDVPTTLERIESQYHGATILFFSNGACLLKPFTEDLTDSGKLFKQLERSFVVTPKPRIDWFLSERILLKQELRLVSADPQSLSAILTNGEERYTTTNTYSASVVIRSLVHLKDYLHNAFLESWVMALATYPRVDWSMAVRIGKEVKDKLFHDDPTAVVDYASLLKLARIDWMNEGKMPEPLREEILKVIPLPVELTARETVENLLTKFGEKVKNSSLVNLQFAIEKTVNRFVLNKIKGENHAETEKTFLRFHTLGMTDRATGAAVAKAGRLPFSYRLIQTNSWSGYIIPLILSVGTFIALNAFVPTSQPENFDATVELVSEQSVLSQLQLLTITFEGDSLLADKVAFKREVLFNNVPINLLGKPAKITLTYTTDGAIVQPLTGTIQAFGTTNRVVIGNNKPPIQLEVRYNRDELEPAASDSADTWRSRGFTVSTMMDPSVNRNLLVVSEEEFEEFRKYRRAGIQTKPGAKNVLYLHRRNIECSRELPAGLLGLWSHNNKKIRFEMDRLYISNNEMLPPSRNFVLYDSVCVKPRLSLRHVVIYSALGTFVVDKLATEWRLSQDCRYPCLSQAVLIPVRCENGLNNQVFTICLDSKGNLPFDAIDPLLNAVEQIDFDSVHYEINSLDYQASFGSNLNLIPGKPASSNVTRNWLEPEYYKIHLIRKSTRTGPPPVDPCKEVFGSLDDALKKSPDVCRLDLSNDPRTSPPDASELSRFKRLEQLDVRFNAWGLKNMRLNEWVAEVKRMNNNIEVYTEPQFDDRLGYVAISKGLDEEREKASVDLLGNKATWFVLDDVITRQKENRTAIIYFVIYANESDLAQFRREILDYYQRNKKKIKLDRVQFISLTPMIQRSPRRHPYCTVFINYNSGN